MICVCITSSQDIESFLGLRGLATATYMCWYRCTSTNSWLHLFPLMLSFNLLTGFCRGLSYWSWSMLANSVKEVLSQKRYLEEQQWEYLKDSSLEKTRSTVVFMTCQYFDYSFDRHARTFVVCRMHECLIPHGEHLTSGCLHWYQRINEEVGLCAVAA